MSKLGAFVVTREGKKLPVDTSSISDEECIRIQQNVGLYPDDTTLEPVWILELNKLKATVDFRNGFELEWVKDIVYYHEPTKEEILYAMSQYGLSMSDIVIVRKGYEIETGEIDEGIFD